MYLNSSTRLPTQCFYSDCPSVSGDSSFVHLVRKGFFFRSSDSKYIARFQCKICNRSFSSARYSSCFLQKRRRLNDPIREHLAQGMTQRQIARVLKTSRKTVERKLRFLAAQARLTHQQFLMSLVRSNNKLDLVQFDEMETFERSKCLPVSIPLIVEPKTRKILAIGACSMPAKGLLAAISVKKYGPRRDERPECAQKIFKQVDPVLAPAACIFTDQNPKYPAWINTHSSTLISSTTKGRRGCIVGQGELKGGGFDPLFSLNHSCAMIRAHVSRLFRRTWNTTKRIDRLEDHLYIYINYHNQVLTR